MTNPVIPTTIAALPPAPTPSDTPANFDAKAFALLTAQVDMVSEYNASAGQTYINAVSAKESADSSTASAGTATVKAGEASTSAGTAAVKAGEASASAASASASAVSASKLNLGPKPSPPAVDNQGAALQQGATYYDTRPVPDGGWKVWTGSGWAAGLNFTAGVSSLNGKSGALTNTTLADYGITNAVAQTVICPNNTDVNNLVVSGFYRLQEGNTNCPVGSDYGQVIVASGVSTVAQQIIQCLSGYMLTRAGVLGAFTPWRRVAFHNDAVAVANAGAMDCSVASSFTLTVSGNTTLSFTNIPASSSYSCELEIYHAAGTITLPAGSAWANGAAPTLSAGKRHLFFFKQSNTGSGGWLVSALPGYAA